MTFTHDLDTPRHDASGPSETGGSRERLVFVPVSAEDWLIHDTLYPANDARRLVACVRARGLDHVDVIWLRGSGLPNRFARAQQALDAAAESLGD